MTDKSVQTPKEHHPNLNSHHHQIPLPGLSGYSFPPSSCATSYLYYNITHLVCDVPFGLAPTLFLPSSYPLHFNTPPGPSLPRAASSLAFIFTFYLNISIPGCFASLHRPDKDDSVQLPIHHSPFTIHHPTILLLRTTPHLDCTLLS